MLRIRPRFSLKMMLVAVTFVAVGSYLLMLPTVRARRFVELIAAGKLQEAEGMFGESESGDWQHRMTLQHAAAAAITSLTFDQLLHGQRRVIVTQQLDDPMGGKFNEPTTAEFVVHRTEVLPGWHSFNFW